MSDQFQVISARQFMVTVLILFIPAFILVIAIAGRFRSEGFRKHPLRNSLVIIMAIALPVCIHLFPEAASNYKDYKPLLHKNILAMMDMVYGTSAIPPMQDEMPYKAALEGASALAIVADKKKKR